jgi:hypothetical protein
MKYNFIILYEYLRLLSFHLLIFRLLIFLHNIFYEYDYEYFLNITFGTKSCLYNSNFL